MKAFPIVPGKLYGVTVQGYTHRIHAHSPIAALCQVLYHLAEEADMFGAGQ